ncbi:tRNA 2-selenouridine(34) synthase MnmH [Pseudopelagicola sp. nBUS_19]|uniref:tRNA 2-selenouridine(34) synthase MnmH n=1 Tax=Pseudopelagicola sp. nBUS_19 TaxID=3395316 RepID=UPI003EBCDFE6
MPQELTSLAELTKLPFDEIIDVRSPREFAEDHIPGAVSLPALYDDERAQIGTMYVQDDSFKARKIGAALVSRNVASHLEGPLSNREGGWRPLVYCWRGGQRSGSVAMVLKQIGWRTDTIMGGYRQYRRLVVQALYHNPMPCRVVIIDGGTGTAKTHLLSHLADQGAQTLDLESLAKHRGSLFGSMNETQPSQKAFESSLAIAVTNFDAAKPIYVEAESSKIGQLIIPPTLWKAMIAAPSLRLTAPVAARANHLITAYPDMIENKDKLCSALQQLTRYHSRELTHLWETLAHSGDYRSLATQLIEAHYDPRYARISRGHAPNARVINLPDLDNNTLSKTATSVLKMQL